MTEQTFYQKEFSQNPTAPAWLEKRQQTALTYLLEKGLPSKHAEDWKYTRVADKAEFVYSRAHEKTQDLTSIKARILASPYRVVFIDGVYSNELSTPHLQSGIHLQPLRAALEHPICLSHLMKLTEAAEESFAALNSAFFQDGIFLHLLENQRLEQPLHIFYFSTQAESAQHMRHLVVAEKNSHADCVVHTISLVESPHALTLMSEVFLNDHAHVEWHLLPELNAKTVCIEKCWVQQATHSAWRSYSFGQGGALSRSDIQVYLQGPHAQCDLYGWYNLNQQRHLDHHLQIDHNAPHTTSTQFYRGVLHDNARGVFNGKTIVSQQAPKANAKQSNANLLLSKTAEINTKPELEIYAQDVKCTHGATVGALNEESLFYLQARGIPLEVARNMLIEGFSAACFSAIQHKQLRTDITAQWKKFA